MSAVPTDPPLSPVIPVLRPRKYAAEPLGRVAHRKVGGGPYGELHPTTLEQYPSTLAREAQLQAANSGGGRSVEHGNHTEGPNMSTKQAEKPSTPVPTKEALDNRSRQLNSQDPLYWRSRGQTPPPKPSSQGQNG